jgi:hypothetical protein
MGWSSGEKESSFLKKRSKKLLSGCRGPGNYGATARIKVFGSFFKKNRFLKLVYEAVGVGT